MVRVFVTSSLKKRIIRKFSKSEADEIFCLFFELEKNPLKGKALAHIAEWMIKELKYDTYRFYFLQRSDNFIKFLSDEDLKNEIIKFVEMSKKNNQQEVIEKIKLYLKKKGFDYFI